MNVCSRHLIENILVITLRSHNFMLALLGPQNNTKRYYLVFKNQTIFQVNDLVMGGGLLLDELLPCNKYGQIHLIRPSVLLHGTVWILSRRLLLFIIHSKHLHTVQSTYIDCHLESENIICDVSI